MPGARDDYLLRMIQQVAAILRRLRQRVTDGNASDELKRDASAAIGELLGSQRPILEMLDPHSAASLVGDADKLALWIALLRLQADIARGRGEIGEGDKFAARAVALERALPAKS